jgi:hypothetical protein
MQRNLVLGTLAVVVATLLAAASPVNAQATRTWVSGVGDDANPCSRTAPCKTFAGAISKTAAGGEINVLDPGGFGAVTITKSITISSEGFEAGVLVSGTNGIVVSAAPTDFIVLRGLDIEGLGTGLAGIKVLSAGRVFVEKCTINRFTQIGIDFVPTSATAGSTSQLHVNDSIIRNNTGASSGGIRVKPGTNVSASGSVVNTKLLNNQFGLRVEDNSNVSSKDSVASGNTGAGFIAVSSGATAVLSVDGCLTTNNQFGLKADNSPATIRFANCTIAGNGTGISSGNTGLGNGNTVTFTGSNNNADPGTANGSIPRQ